ncbi:hypothetical protein RQP46_009753 [Phenoliferia psychrophenolica]
MLLSLLALPAAFAISSCVGAQSSSAETPTSLPSEIVLNTPANGTIVNTPGLWYGFSHGRIPSGIYRDLAWTLTLPNGTVTANGGGLMPDIDGEPLRCSGYLAGDSTNITMPDTSQVGTYTLRFNVTYAIPTSVNFSPTDTECLGPFSYQSIILTDAFE